MCKLKQYIQALLVIGLFLPGCKVPAIVQVNENKSVPVAYENGRNTSNTASDRWRQFFTDPNLVNLIDTALTRNQELMMTLQEIEIAKNDVRFRHGSLLPVVGARL